MNANTAYHLAMMMARCAQVAAQNLKFFKDVIDKETRSVLMTTYESSINQCHCLKQKVSADESEFQDQRNVYVKVINAEMVTARSLFLDAQK